MDTLVELRALISRHTREGYNPGLLDDVHLVASPLRTKPLPALAEPVVSVVAQGAKRIVLGNNTYDYSAGKYLVVSVDLPVTSHTVRASAEKPLLCCGLVLKPAMIASLLLETTTNRPDATGSVGIAVSDLSPDLLDPIVRLLRLLDRPQDIAVLRDMIEREILWRLLTGEQGAMIRQIGLADSRLSQISRAIRWIRHHYAETLHIDDLAHQAGMSASSFHRHFRAVTSRSPLQFQKRIRLQEARTRLMTQTHNVAEVGFAVGYDSPSQFNREYRRLFGNTPGKDATQMRPASINTSTG